MRSEKLMRFINSPMVAIPWLSASLNCGPADEAPPDDRACGSCARLEDDPAAVSATCGRAPARCGISCGSVGGLRGPLAGVLVVSPGGGGVPRAAGPLI